MSYNVNSNKMRIHSNTLLSLPHIIHAFRAAYKNPGRWGNLYVFHIEHTKPLVLTTYSPIKLLQENIKYYCYDDFYRNKHLEKIGNIYEPVYTDGGKKTYINIPKCSAVNDIIIIRNDNPSDNPSAIVPSWLKFYSPPLP